MYTISRRSPFLALIFFFLIISGCSSHNSTSTVEKSTKDSSAANAEAASSVPSRPWTESTLDTAAYDRIVKELANGDTTGKWPAKAPRPLAGAVLPFYRIIAFYGNLYSKKMGILGELPKDSMLMKLQGELKQWQAADSSLPVLPALHYIAITAQGAAGRDGKYRARMPHSQIDTIMNWAKSINALTFLDVQVGHSRVMDEVPTLEEYLKQPTVHLGIDPEFSMKGGEVPGSKIGTYNSDDINAVIDYLAGLVRKNNIPPKILVVHRFTEGMVRGYQNIKKLPEVQVVIDMDGWGDKTLKRSSYLAYIYRDPVQFSGFKLFYKNDNKKAPNGMYTPSEVLRFTPRPIYIQYQ